ncbi:MAG: ABC transporter permease, partial [Pseudomonadota bacterium]
IIAGGVTVLAALTGAAKSIWTIVSLPPAVAMRPAAPVTYRRFLFGGLHKFSPFSQLTTMALRHLIRWPVRSLMTTLATSLSIALLVTALFSWDSIDYMIDTIFFRADRQDATLTFVDAKGPDALQRAAALPGVVRAEPFRTTSVKLKSGHRELRMSIMGIAPNADLSRVLDLELTAMPLPQEGLILSERVAEKLRLRPGDRIEIELLEKQGRMISMPVSALAASQPGMRDTATDGGLVTKLTFVALSQSYVGLTAYMSLEGLNRLMRDGRKISGARILIDRNRLPDLYRAVKETPAIASIALQKISRDRFRETINENIAIMNRVYVALAVIITFGVIYNSARIQLSERARELASLRVFGFTRPKCLAF